MRKLLWTLVWLVLGFDVGLALSYHAKRYSPASCLADRFQPFGGYNGRGDTAVATVGLRVSRSRRDTLWDNREDVVDLARQFAFWAKTHPLEWWALKQSTRRLDPDDQQQLVYTALVVRDILQAENDPALNSAINLLTGFLNEE